MSVSRHFKQIRTAFNDAERLLEISMKRSAKISAKILACSAKEQVKFLKDSAKEEAKQESAP